MESVLFYLSNVINYLGLTSFIDAAAITFRLTFNLAVLTLSVGFVFCSIGIAYYFRNEINNVLSNIVGFIFPQEKATEQTESNSKGEGISTFNSIKIEAREKDEREVRKQQRLKQQRLEKEKLEQELDEAKFVKQRTECFKQDIAKIATTHTIDNNYYKTLDLQYKASINSVKKNYKALAKSLHTDKLNDTAKTEQFKIIRDAYEVLGNEELKVIYDNNLFVEQQEIKIGPTSFGRTLNQLRQSELNILMQSEQIKHYDEIIRSSKKILIDFLKTSYLVLLLIQNLMNLIRFN